MSSLYNYCFEQFKIDAKRQLFNLISECNSEDILALENSNSNLNYQKGEMNCFYKFMSWFFMSFTGLSVAGNHRRINGFISLCIKLKTYPKYWHLFDNHPNSNINILLFLLFSICWEQLTPHKHLERLN